jgi:hypothetical protein
MRIVAPLDATTGAAHGERAVAAPPAGRHFVYLPVSFHNGRIPPRDQDHRREAMAWIAQMR